MKFVIYVNHVGVPKKYEEVDKSLTSLLNLICDSEEKAMKYLKNLPKRTENGRYRTFRIETV